MAEAAAHNGVRLTVRVSGVVQGVGFRYLTARKARALGLVGEAVNRADGSVGIIAEGARPQAAALLAWLRSPDSPGFIDAIEAEYGPAQGGFAGFGTG
ncbi:acylphosphatase [Arthrobacter sp. 35W]|uniref:acylphosphatase n=1 Tax=Arthrobacter sp. 35W TaxID=1132441 RepID=UPI0003FEC2A3|nr:acylphosphatase [Arthrobacter sp. 35W]